MHSQIILVAQEIEALGFEFVGIQDHPYQWRFLDTWTLMAMIAAKTERLRIFPDVANLPLRPPSMLAKSAATIDLLSGGRFELVSVQAHFGMRLWRWVGRGAAQERQ
jgi:alkanesulfonate monooxygenase SsuD/methylene tetrahydromethanopterin reductase-like flavin-dependent oxidoreductase (luciferase family)